MEDNPALANGTDPRTPQSDPTANWMDWTTGLAPQAHPPTGWSMNTNDRRAAYNAMTSGGTWFDTADVARHYGIPLGTVVDAQGNFVGVFPTAGMEGLPPGSESLAYRLNPATEDWQGVKMPTGRFGMPDWGFGLMEAALMLGGGVAGGLLGGGAAGGAAAATAGAEAGSEAALASSAALPGVYAAGAAAEAPLVAAATPAVAAPSLAASLASNPSLWWSYLQLMQQLPQTQQSGGSIGSLVGSLAGTAAGAALGIPGGGAVGRLAGGEIGGAVDPQTGESVATRSALPQADYTKLATALRSVLGDEQAAALLQNPQSQQILLLLLALLGAQGS
jgi:hypothetical protein